MRPYRAMFSARFRSLLQYRAAAVAGFCTQVFWGLIRMMIFSAFYAGVQEPMPMDLQQVIAYVWLGQAFFAMIPLRPDRDIEQLIRTGNVAYEILRPVDQYNLWYSRAAANCIAPAMLRAVPILVISLVAGWLYWPGALPVACSAASMLAAAMLSAAFSTLMTITMFWTISGRGITVLASILAYTLSGIVIPLPFFPDSVQWLLNALPFRGLIDVPFRIFTGSIPPASVPVEVASQLAWTAVLVLAGRMLLARSVRRVVVQGG
ncbi:MAG TPA: ABC-2 family transporter protein [Planctomycetota bacterium]|nr:ABC-2 family transporter protein [Planctomycetota bacterium]